MFLDCTFFYLEEDNIISILDYVSINKLPTYQNVPDYKIYPIEEVDNCKRVIDSYYHSDFSKVNAGLFPNGSKVYLQALTKKSLMGKK